MIRHACRKNGTDFPTFEFGPTSMMVEFTGTVPTERTRQKEEDPADRTASESSVKTSVKASVKTSVKILEYIAESPETTIPELAEVTGVTTRSVDKFVRGAIEWEHQHPDRVIHARHGDHVQVG
jgi:ATP-dependent DNA helicase RecG